MEDIAKALANDIPMYEPEGDHMIAAQDVLEAVKKGDAKALSSALKAHYAMCEASQPEGE